MCVKCDRDAQSVQNDAFGSALAEHARIKKKKKKRKKFDRDTQKKPCMFTEKTHEMTKLYLAESVICVKNLRRQRDVSVAVFFFYALKWEDAHLVLTRDDNVRTNFFSSYLAVTNTDTRFGAVIYFGSTDSPLTHIVAGCRVLYTQFCGRKV